MNSVWKDILNKEAELDQNDLESIKNIKALQRDMNIIKNDNAKLRKIEQFELFEIAATLAYLTGQLGNDKNRVQEKFRT
ncbi:MAG: hypothetical protein GF311_02130, partial [Candidatus Lokiarchaeota archaeon]|nr:hypothetical protein [Candidatus Lokiarchaeota archaeon]